MTKISRERVAYWAWLWKQRQWWFLRTIPEEWDTVIFTGLPGAGKTTMGSDLAINYLRRGYRVYSNNYIRDTYTGLESRACLTWVDVLTASVEGLEAGEPTIIYLSEIQRMCDAREWQATPKWWSEFMQNRRHYGVALIADTQHVSQVEKRLRMLIGRVVLVESTWLRRHWRRWPRFLIRDVDMQLGDDPASTGLVESSKPRAVWMRSHAFHGHSTWELLPGKDFSDMTEEESAVIVDDLKQRAIACMKVRYLPAFPDDYSAPLRAEFNRITGPEENDAA